MKIIFDSSNLYPKWLKLQNEFSKRPKLLHAMFLSRATFELLLYDD
jgi:hypothetical protein